MNRTKYILLTISIAILTRVGLNIAREQVFFHKHFIYYGAEYAENSVVSDSIWYDQAARAFLAGHGILSMNGDIVPSKYFPSTIETKLLDKGPYYAHKIVPPVYPLFLSLCYYIGGMNTLSYFIPQLLVSILTCLLIYFLAAELFSEKVARLAGITVALYPDLIFWTNTIRTETLFIFLLTLFFYLVIDGNLHENIGLAIGGSAIFGLASLTRITLLPFLPFLIIWLFIEYRKNILTPFIMIAIILLTLLPWSLRNQLVFGKFSPLTDEINAVLSGESWNKKENFDEIQKYYKAHESTTIRIAVFIKDHFTEFVKASIDRFIAFWSPFRPPNKLFAKIYKTITWIIIFPLAFYGIIISAKQWRKNGLIISFIIYYSLLHSLSFVDDGLVYRYPIQPFLCIYFAYGAVCIYNTIARRGLVATRVLRGKNTGRIT